MNRRVLRGFLLLVMILVTVGAVSNVFLDNTEVRLLAEKTACGQTNDPPGTCAMTQMERTPIAQTFELVAKTKKLDGVTVHASCMRSAILFGAYSCTKE